MRRVYEAPSEPATAAALPEHPGRAGRGKLADFSEDVIAASARERAANQSA